MKTVVFQYAPGEGIHVPLEESVIAFRDGQVAEAMCDTVNAMLDWCEQQPSGVARSRFRWTFRSLRLS